MLSLTALESHAAAFRELATIPVPPTEIHDRKYDLDGEPALMGVVNLSRDSTYRDSIAVSTESAVRRARTMAAQGASFIDLGAESSTLRAARVGADEQTRILVPVISRLRDLGIVTSVESYESEVLRACLAAGAGIVNLTGAQGQDAAFELAAEHGAAVVICYSPGANVREVHDLHLDSDPFPALVDHFGPRLARAAELGVRSALVDPGMGFYYGNLTDPMVRARHQARVLLGSYRLRVLGAPVCQALPHAFDLFEEEFRTAEGFFAVLAALAGTHLYRTHEVSRVRPVLAAMRALAA